MSETYQQRYYRTVTKPKKQQFRAERDATLPLHPIALARKQRGMSQTELARAMGLDETAARRVNNWEHGRAIPVTLYADKLAQVLGLESGAAVQQLCRDWQAAQQGKDKHD